MLKGTYLIKENRKSLRLSYRSRTLLRLPLRSPRHQSCIFQSYVYKLYIFREEKRKDRKHKVLSHTSEHTYFGILEVHVY